jgi:hypothetical protein
VFGRSPNTQLKFVLSLSADGLRIILRILVAACSILGLEEDRFFFYGFPEFLVANGEWDTAAYVASGRVRKIFKSGVFSFM